MGAGGCEGGGSPPPWVGLTGVKRVMAEFKYLAQQVKAGALPQVSGLTFVDDQVTVWQFRLR